MNGDKREILWSLLFLVAVCAAGVLNSLSYKSSNPSPVPVPEADHASAQDIKTTPKFSAPPPKPYVPPIGSQWIYTSNPDEMGRGTVKQALVVSTNTLNFGSPYSGPQNGTLVIRKDPKFGKDVYINIARGQFLCSYPGCSVGVRFDNDKAKVYEAVGPSDYSTTSLFILGYDRFVARLKRSKKVSIEAEFFQEGERVLTFDTSGFVDK
jgi:hypothetical protein